MTDVKKKYKIVLLLIVPLIVLPPLIYWASRILGREEAALAVKPIFQRQSAKYIQPDPPPAPATPRGGLPRQFPDYYYMLPPGQKRTSAQAGKPAPARWNRAPAVTSEKQRETDFLRKHDRQVKSYQTYLRNLGRRYMGKYPALRQVDSHFGKMPRYMALKRQYESDRDAYKWARGVVRLPEVRKAIINYAGNPEVVKAMVELSLEALRNPPPASVNDEVMRVLTTDEKVSPYISDITMGAAGNLASALPFAITPGTDISSLQQLGKKIASGGR